MKLTDEQIESIYGEWWNKYSHEQPYRGLKYDASEAFKAAISLLLPIIEKLQESNELYGNKELWSRTGRGTPEVPCFSNFIEHSVDTEWFPEESRHVSGGIARKTKQEVEQMIEKLGEDNGR